MTAPARPGPRMTADELAVIRERDAEWDGGDPRDRWQTRERIDDAFRDRRALLREVDALRAEVEPLTPPVTTCELCGGGLAIWAQREGRTVHVTCERHRDFYEKGTNAGLPPPSPERG